MSNVFLKRLVDNIEFSMKLLRKQKLYERVVCNVVGLYQSQWCKVQNFKADFVKEGKDGAETPLRQYLGKKRESRSVTKKCSSDKDRVSSTGGKSEIAWLAKKLEPALQLCRQALPSGTEPENKIPPISRSVSEIIASIQRSKLVFKDWSLSDLTLGLYLIYIQQASTNPLDDVQGVQISSESIVHDLIYHTELAKGAYRASVTGLAKRCMLRESNVYKFVKESSVLRPGYYIGVDKRKKLVILGIRGTHTVYDLITDIVSSSHEEIISQGFSSHFGTAEAARWFLNHELETIKNCLEQNEGFSLRLVGHSLGGATASLLAIMLRQKSSKELGFSPDIVSAIGYATPACISRDLADNCSEYVTTVVMQDDIIPRLSVASLTRLRNEILQTDWTSVLEKEDWKNVVDLFTNAKLVITSVQDVARKLVDYAKFRSQTELLDVPENSCSVSASTKLAGGSGVINKKEAPSRMSEELFIPGTVYFLKRNIDSHTCLGHGKGGEFFTLWKRNPGEHFQRILFAQAWVKKLPGSYMKNEDSPDK
ncbi:Fungal lipase-like domain containing protein [Heracleum sosnowskyi]|uniref:Fungal lipase-like domain containing protein n=1 Tax=Heracleum sosnowskyi TaxID=360622 RepID=A0AAD8HTS9_9APIA|nr:Fungal lipase-like domain containing protein [Heracleum sosnowskyi]